MSHRIGVVFDFDDTLAPDSTSGFLEHVGLDVGNFWDERVQPKLDADWDPIPAYLHELIEESRRRPEGERFTREVLAAYGSTIRPYEGVPELFETLRAVARDVDESIEVEYYLISSGLGDILRAAPVFEHFRDAWACEFHYGDDGSIAFPRSIVSFTEKTKFLYKISKGLVGERSRGRPFEVNERARGFRIPFAHMLYVGDGHTDIPCFSLLKGYEASALAVFDPDSDVKRSKSWGLVRDRRVAGSYRARYGPDADLHHALVAGVEDIARRIVARDGVV